MTLRLTLENVTGLPATVATSIDFGTREQLIIGRSQAADWVLPDPSRLLSGKHCEIRRVGEQYQLYDLSSNGTFLDEHPDRISSPYPLSDGDRLLLGAYRMRVELSDTDEADATRIVTRAELAPALLTPPTPARKVLPSLQDPPPGRRARKAQRGGDPAALLVSEPSAAPMANPEGAGRNMCASAGEDGITRLAPASKRLPPAGAIVEKSAVMKASAPLETTHAEDTTGVATTGHEAILAAIARGLGLSPADLHTRDPAILGEQLAELVLLLTGGLRGLMILRDTMLERPSARPMLAATNALAIMPTTEEAVRVLFGPPRKAYLDPHQSFENGLEELRDYLQQTGSSIRNAARVMSSELAPPAIERSVPAEGRLGQILSTRKARLWDIYAERWQKCWQIRPERAVASFVECFSDDQGNRGKTRNQ